MTADEGFRELFLELDQEGDGVAGNGHGVLFCNQIFCFEQQSSAINRQLKEIIFQIAVLLLAIAVQENTRLELGDGTAGGAGDG